MCSAWQPLPCRGILALGVLESCHEGLELFLLLTWELWGPSTAWVCPSGCCLRRSRIHRVWPGGVLRTKSRDVASSPCRRQAAGGGCGAECQQH